MTEHFNLQQWLDWISQQHSQAIDLGLERISTVASRMNLLQPKPYIITLAGTNGKGSSLTYLRNIFNAAGYKVGSYSSPHFQCYNERICIDAEPVQDSAICQAFQAIKQVSKNVSLSYFEYGTLAALEIFAQHQLDFLLLEVGLGGRLDAVNIVDPDLAIITSIGLDHTDWLGDDLEVIAGEKAGIFRSNQLAVSGVNPALAKIKQTADNLGTELYQLDEEFSYQTQDNNWCWQGTNRAGEQVEFTALPLPQLPIQNAATVMQVLQIIPFEIPLADIHSGLTQAQMTGRMQKLNFKGKEVLLDVTHNPDAAKLLVENLAQIPKKIQLVLAMLEDKDYAQVIEILKPQISLWYVSDLSDPRAAQAKHLIACLSAEQDEGRCHSFSRVEDALQSALAQQEADSLVLVAGSFVTVTRALDYLGVK